MATLLCNLYSVKFIFTYENYNIMSSFWHKTKQFLGAVYIFIVQDYKIYIYKYIFSCTIF